VSLSGSSLFLTVLGLGLLFLAFEFAIVSNIALLSELVPEKRSTLMAVFFAIMTAGRAGGAIFDPRLWGATENFFVHGATENFFVHGIVSLLTIGGAFLVGWSVLREQKVGR
jgi:hypothetical protein